MGSAWPRSPLSLLQNVLRTHVVREFVNNFPLLLGSVTMEKSPCVYPWSEFLFCELSPKPSMAQSALSLELGVIQLAKCLKYIKIYIYILITLMNAGIFRRHLENILSSPKGLSL